MLNKIGPFSHGHFGLGRFGPDISATENAKRSGAEMSEHHVTYVPAGFDKVLLALVLGCYGRVQRGTGGPDKPP